MMPICYIELKFTILGTNVSKSIFKCIFLYTRFTIFRILFDKISIYKSAFSVQKGLNKKLLLLKAQSNKEIHYHHFKENFASLSKYSIALFSRFQQNYSRDQIQSGLMLQMGIFTWYYLNKASSFVYLTLGTD